MPRHPGLKVLRGGCLGGEWEWEPGGGGRGSARLSRDPALDACLGCDPPPRGGVLATPQAFPWLPRGACWARWNGGEADPHLLNTRAGKLTWRLERQPPRPHPGKPVRETDSLRDPDINAVRIAGLLLAGPRPPHPPLHVRPGPRAGTGGGWWGGGQRPALGTSGRAGEDSPQRVTTSPKLSWLPPPPVPSSLPGAGGHSTLVLAFAGQELKS